MHRICCCSTTQKTVLLKRRLLVLLIITAFFNFHWKGVAALGEQVYQPVPSEIDRFKMVQEKIQQQEQQEQNNLVEEDQMQQMHRPGEADEGGGGGHLARHHPLLNHHHQQQFASLQPPSSHLQHHPHPFLSHLLQRLTGAAAAHHQPTFVMSHPPPQQQQQQFQQQQESPSLLPPAQHHLEQSSSIPSPSSLSPLLAPSSNQHFPVLPQFPQVSPAIQQQLAGAQPHQVGGIVGDPLESSLHSGAGGLQQQGAAGSSLSAAPHLHPETYQTLMQKNLVLPGEVPPSIDKQLETMNSGGEEMGMETKGDDKDRDNLQNGERNDRGGSGGHNHHRGGSSSLLGPRRCYACSWSIAQCADFNCYNNPDICTNNHFKAHRVHQADCPSGCEQYVVTDPNGLIQTWKRGCAPPSLPIKGYRCKTHYEFGIRIDRCICNRDWCNLATSLHQSGSALSVLLLPCFSLLLHWLLLNRLL